MIRHMTSGYWNYAVKSVPVREWDDWEVCLVVAGEMAPVFPDGRKLPPEHAYIWLIPPAQAHGWHGGDLVKRYKIHLTDIPTPLKLAFYTRDYVGRTVARAEIHKFIDIYERLEKLNKNPSSLCSLKIDKALLDMAIVILEGMKLDPIVPRVMMDERRVEAVLAWYREHMSESPSIEDAADAVGVSSMHLRRIFQRVQSIPPSKIFTKMRVERARELLTKTTMDLHQVSRQSGFRSDSRFCRVFKQHVGVSPNHLRLVISQKEAIMAMDHHART